MKEYTYVECFKVCLEENRKVTIVVRVKNMMSYLIDVGLFMNRREI